MYFSLLRKHFYPKLKDTQHMEDFSFKCILIVVLVDFFQLNKDFGTFIMMVKESMLISVLEKVLLHL